jgi:hypothetical protein
MSNTHTVNESLMAAKPFQLMRDFAPIAPINSSDLVLVARSALPVAKRRELIAAAKAKSRGMTYASSGPGTPYHMAASCSRRWRRLDPAHPLQRELGARTDVLGGQVDLMFDAVTTMTEHVRSAKVKAIGTTGKARSEVMPEVPTIAESGVPGYEADDLARADGAEGDAAADRLAPQRRGRQDRRHPDVVEGVAGARRGADDDEHRRVHEVPRRRHRQVGAHRQGLRRQARAVTAPRSAGAGDGG